MQRRRIQTNQSQISIETQLLLDKGFLQLNTNYQALIDNFKYAKTLDDRSLARYQIQRFNQLIEN